MSDRLQPRESRRYDSSGRRARAAETRARMLEAAHELFETDGYASTTIAAIAKRAQVSTPTVHAAFGTKAEILKQVIDVALAGDDEDVAVADRPLSHWVAEAKTAPELLARYAVMMGELARRAAPIYDVLLRAADTDPALAALVEQFEAQRLTGADRIAKGVATLTTLPEGRSRRVVRDVVWFCNGPEQYTMLVTKRGWSVDRYVAWMTDVLLRVLDPPTGTSAWRDS